ncbi:acyltransferase Pun1-like [Arachis hypogaea]|uniref:Uncharacterized protein n=1 Tax=Arachis hypogaea TaxID=3818 RepID=A0A444X9L9_ARAHY|nr:acylsugar acyltransferase 3-like [Arachis hypogaea]RYQ86389.1 hypothetical protein Ahy_B10g106063 [Arachis hypogaea]
MNNPEHDSIMAIQINCFHCEGIAITLCASHKLGDIFTLINFINDWAAITNHHQDRNHPLRPYQEKPYFSLPKSIYKRFVFEASEIKALKATVAPIHPTRFEAMAALICKCAAFALGLGPNSSMLNIVAVNLCKRMDPPVSSKTLGNMITFFIFGGGVGGGGGGSSGNGGGGR